MKLSALQLPSLPAGDYPNSAYPGLSFRVGKKKRVWSLRYRHGEKQKRETLGAYPKMGLKDARWAAEAFLDRIRAGAPATPAAKQESGETLGDLIDAFRAHAESRRQPHQDAGEGDADRPPGPRRLFAAPCLVLHQGRSARRPRCHRRGAQPHGQSLPRQRRAEILKWAVAESRGIETNFPAIYAGRPRRRGTDPCPTPRSRPSLRPSRASLTGVGRPPAHSPRLIRFLLLTGRRLGEARALAAWRYPRRHLAPARQQGRPSASRLSLATGAGGNRQRAGARALLPGLSGAPIVQITKPLRDLQAASGTSGWRVHDLRRTFAAGCQDWTSSPASSRVCSIIAFAASWASISSASRSANAPRRGAQSWADAGGERVTSGKANLRRSNNNIDYFCAILKLERHYSVSVIATILAFGYV